MRRCVFVPGLERVRERLDRGQERLLEVLEARRVCDREPRLVRDPREELHRPLGKPRLRPVLDDRDDEPLAVVVELDRRDGEPEGVVARERPGGRREVLGRDDERFGPHGEHAGRLERNADRLDAGAVGARVAPGGRQTIAPSAGSWSQTEARCEPRIFVVWAARSSRTSSMPSAEASSRERSRSAFAFSALSRALSASRRSAS